MGKIVLLTAVFAHAVFGQPQAEDRRVEELLASPSVVDKAWGVFFAGRLHLPSLNARLVDQLISMEPYSGAALQGEQRALLHAIFDGLIVSGTVVPARTLMPFAEQWRDEVLILLARERNIEELLIDLRDKDLRQPQWLLVNNLLLRPRSPLLFAKILNEIQITHRFLIFSKGGGRVSGGGDGSGVACLGDHQLPKGFPPIGVYELVARPEEGATLVARGPQDVYYRRTVVPPGGHFRGSVELPALNKQRHHREYLAALLRINLDQIKPLFSARSRIEWHGQNEFAREARAALDTQTIRIQSLLAGAKELGFATPSGKVLKTAVEIEDTRLTAPTALSKYRHKNSAYRRSPSAAAPFMRFGGSLTGLAYELQAISAVVIAGGSLRGEVGGCIHYGTSFERKRSARHQSIFAGRRSSAGLSFSRSGLMSCGRDGGRLATRLLRRNSRAASESRHTPRCSAAGIPSVTSGCTVMQDPS